MSAFSFSKRLQSFVHAFRGAGTLVRTQHNAWIHLATTILVVIAGIVLGLSRAEWISVSIAIALVWMAEAFNTAVEFLADEITQERKDRIKKAKDVAAFGVLVSAFTAAVIGFIVFSPHLSQLKLLGPR